MFVWFMLMQPYLLVFGCFFFFKHKTAYERRIRDWSSDVCSSDLAQVDMDLPRPLAGGRTLGQKGLDRQLPVAIARGPARRVEKQIFAIFETEERQRDKIVAPRLAPEQDREVALHVAKLVRHGQRRHHRIAQRRADLGRSEEHTSALQ